MSEEIRIKLPRRGTGYRNAIEAIAGDLYLYGIGELTIEEAMRAVRDTCGDVLAEIATERRINASGN